MTIRPREGSGREELVRMATALWPDCAENDLEALFGLSPSEGIALVAERDNGGLGGFAEVGLRKYAEGCDTSPVAYLEGIWIDSDLRRTGVASDLVQEAEGWTRASGIEEFASDCQIDNFVSEAFHRAVGFIEARRNICWRRDVPPGSA
jgi:aminoglycoside 6'-N-acetyltransferase I